MFNFITSILFLTLLTPNQSFNKCQDYFNNHPVQSEIMLQVVLKSYGYYDGKIDGQFGSKSRNALIQFQSNNSLIADGVVGNNTCTLLLNKSKIIQNNKTTTVKVNNYSQEIYDAQSKLKSLVSTRQLSMVLMGLVLKSN